MGKAISDEMLMCALLSTPTVTAAADKAGCSRSTVIRRLSETAFQQALYNHRRAILQTVTAKMAKASAEAIDVLLGIASSDTSTNDERIRAASCILKSCGSFCRDGNREISEKPTGFESIFDFDLGDKP